MKRKIIREESLAEQMTAHASGKPDQEENGKLFVPTGSALLNLALSDKADGGFLAGKIVNLIGDSSSGKTFLALTLLAEVAHDSAFDFYNLIYDDAEAANEFDLVKLFGKKTADRIKAPMYDSEGNPVYSHTMLGFQSSIRRLLKAGEPFIYIQDSFDALTTEEELKHAIENQKAYEAGKETKGTYGMNKAAQASVMLRLLATDVKKTNSLVIIISQTRDNIDPMSFQKKTRAGGKALYFYCSYEMWLAVAQKLSVKINDKNRRIGVLSRIKISKNKFNGKVREIDLPIMYSYGVDDISACIDFLVTEGYWTKSGSGMIDAKGLRTISTRTKLISKVEQEDLYEALYNITQKAWMEIEEKLKSGRKPKYE